MSNSIHVLTSVEISYTRYLLRMKPCWPSILTVTLSCFFHQLLGRPVPAILEVAPLLRLPLVGTVGALGNFGTLQGSSEYALVGTGARTSDGYCPKPDTPGASDDRSSSGTGSACAHYGLRTSAILQLCSVRLRRFHAQMTSLLS